jgi:hypothetical protein
LNCLLSQIFCCIFSPIRLNCLYSTWGSLLRRRQSLRSWNWTVCVFVSKNSNYERNYVNFHWSCFVFIMKSVLLAKQISFWVISFHFHLKLMLLKYTGCTEDIHIFLSYLDMQVMTNICAWYFLKSVCICSHWHPEYLNSIFWIRRVIKYHKIWWRPQLLATTILLWFSFHLLLQCSPSSSTYCWKAREILWFGWFETWFRCGWGIYHLEFLVSISCSLKLCRQY